MGYIPLFMDVDARRCIVIGSGETALRRVRALLDAGAEVTAVGRDAGIEALGEAGLARLWEAGRRMSLERTMEYALQGRAEVYELPFTTERVWKLVRNAAGGPSA